jgi:hypothetical protein
VATPSQPVGQAVSYFRILRKIRGGGMAVVYEAEDVKLWNLIESCGYFAEILSLNRRSVAAGARRLVKNLTGVRVRFRVADNS